MTPAVLFSSGLDSAVLLVDAFVRHGSAQPIYVSAGLAWEDEERQMAEVFLAALADRGMRCQLAVLGVDMRDVYPATHWAIRGQAPGYHTPDTDVYLEGRNIVLLSKAAIFSARSGLSPILIGPLAGNPFPDATPVFFEAMSRALSIGLGKEVEIEAPLIGLHKEAVVRLGHSLGVRFELTLSCMQPLNGRHCGRCSKCRERLDAFRAAGVDDPAPYVPVPAQ